MSITEEMNDVFKAQIAHPMIMYEFSEKSRQDIHFFHGDISSFRMRHICRKECIGETMDPMEFSIDPYSCFIAMTKFRRCKGVTDRICNWTQIFGSSPQKITKGSLTQIESMHFFPILLYTFVAHHLIGTQIDRMCLYVWSV